MILPSSCFTIIDTGAWSDTKVELEPRLERRGAGLGDVTWRIVAKGRTISETIVWHRVAIKFSQITYETNKCCQKFRKKKVFEVLPFDVRSCQHFTCGIKKSSASKLKGKLYAFENKPQGILYLSFLLKFLLASGNWPSTCSLPDFLALGDTPCDLMSIGSSFCE